LQSIVDETEMNEWVDLRSWVPDHEISWLYAHATALVVPGLHEGSCLPGLEAMHVGLPVLMSDIPVFHEIAADAAMYFDPLDPRSLAQTMERAMAQPEELVRLAKRGRARTREFTWERTARESLAVFDKALAASA
jgi:glycosyltransferase involved in cell wall biosynthesis